MDFGVAGKRLNAKMMWNVRGNTAYERLESRRTMQARCHEGQPAYKPVPFTHPRLAQTLLAKVLFKGGSSLPIEAQAPC